MPRFRHKGPYLDQIITSAELAKVKPCPYCGEKPFVLTVEPGGYIHCCSCGADGPEITGSFTRDIMEILERTLPLWNRRVS